MIMLALTLLGHAAEPEPDVPHAPHAELGATASNGSRAYAGIAGGWDGQVHLMGRAELWPHIRAQQLEAIGVDVRRPIARVRGQLQAGVDVVDGVRLAAIGELSDGDGRPYPAGEPDRGTVAWGGLHVAAGPTLDAWRVRGVGEVQFSPAVRTSLGRMSGLAWRGWLDVDVHQGPLVVTTALGLGRTSWRLTRSSATSGLHPLARVTVARRF